jgi:hypothetical protein
MTAAEGGGIFISYRRQESSHLAGRLYDRLADRFGEGQVFIDVDTIEPGVDFAEEIFRAVAACKVLLAILGPAWLTAADERGGRRLDDPGDTVRLEIEAALARGVRVIPVLAEGAVMPGQDDLPECLAGLARRNALVIRHESFRYDAGRLVTAIERILAPAPSTVAVSGALEAHGVWSAGTAVDEAAKKDSLPVRNNLGRAIRLHADAERIANSITDMILKAWALKRVAQALAATDPDHAERIANSITRGPEKDSALSGIAQALAATDPDHAERIANSITYQYAKASALSGVAQALAATDPDRAERIANSMTDQSAKASVLSHVAQALAATNPDRATRVFADAERIANSITGRSSQMWALSHVAQALAATDPDHAIRVLADAERIANSITRESAKASALSYVAKVLAATDPDRAERIANSITDRPMRAWALSGVAEALAATSS